MPIHLKTKTEAKTWWQKGCGRRWAMNGVNHKLWGERGSHLSYRNSSIRQSKSIIQTICMQGIQNQKWLFERILYSIRNSIRKRQRKLIYQISHWKKFFVKQGIKSEWPLAHMVWLLFDSGMLLDRFSSIYLSWTQLTRLTNWLTTFVCA